MCDSGGQYCGGGGGFSGGGGGGGGGFGGEIDSFHIASLCKSHSTSHGTSSYVMQRGSSAQLTPAFVNLPASPSSSTAHPTDPAHNPGNSTNYSPRFASDRPRPYSFSGPSSNTVPRDPKIDAVFDLWASHREKVKYAHIYKLAKNMLAIQTRRDSVTSPISDDADPAAASQYRRSSVPASDIIFNRKRSKVNDKDREKETDKILNPRSDSASDSTSASASDAEIPGPRDMSKAARKACEAVLEQDREKFQNMLRNRYRNKPQAQVRSRKFRTRVNRLEWMAAIGTDPPESSWKRAPFELNQQKESKAGVRLEKLRVNSPAVPQFPTITDWPVDPKELIHSRSKSVSTGTSKPESKPKYGFKAKSETRHKPESKSRSGSKAQTEAKDEVKPRFKSKSKHASKSGIEAKPTDIETETRDATEPRPSIEPQSEASTHPGAGPKAERELSPEDQAQLIEV